MELVTGAIGSLLPKLGELLKEEYGLQKGVRKKIKSLSRELQVVHAVLRQIGDVPPDQLDELVRLWVRDMREASYDIEDIVDAFSVSVDGPEEPTDPYILRRLLKKVLLVFKKSKDRRRISSLIQDINKNLQEVAARHGRYTIDSTVATPVAAKAIDPRLLSLYKRASELVGIDRPRDELINKLSVRGDVDVPDNKMKVVSVVGFGGLGKTTLAKAVYDRLKPHFECSAFVPVGRNPDMKKVFRDILIDLGKEKYRNLNMTVLDEKQLMDELKELIKEKRCFIVIDDIWDKESWKLIRCALQDSNCGSRVVVTTRIFEVATHAGEAYKIQPLSRDNSEKLLYARIVDGEGKYFDSPSTEACNKILKKCGGVPLAIITIASLLASKPGEDWSEIYNSIGFGHEVNDDVDNTRKILSFSYYDLSSHLKACLLYLSVFFEDQVIEKDSLIWKWIAEGFIHEEQAAGIGLFELGERYFNELINRSMIQPVETYDEGYVDGCRVHDMVFDLVRLLSREENFVTVLDGYEQQKLPRSIARRLALQRIQEHNGDQLSNIGVDKVRSLIASQCNNIGSFCPRIPVLRVLDMEGCNVGKKGNGGMLDHLGSLLHLRYLRLANISLRELPGEVRYLKFLQILDLSESGIRELPEDVGLLTQLVCLRAGWKITRVPAGLIGKLTSLQELSIRPPEVPAAGADYHAVQVQFVKELGMLRELRVLRTWIRIWDESMERALLESLGNLHNIRTLDIKGGSPLYSDKRYAGFISCRHLQYLCLECVVFSGLPAWIKSSLAPNLSYLDVTVQLVKEQDMETLASLPELRCLNLDSWGQTKLVSIKIRTEGVGCYFRKLRILRMRGLPIWFDLRGCDCNSSVASAIMPSLESLDFVAHVRLLKDAAALLSFDTPLGLENLGRTSLRVIRVEVNCRDARTTEVEEVEAALERTAAVHPKRPILETIRWLAQEDMFSRHQEAWKLADIVDPGHIRALHIPPDPAASSSKVIHLMYTNSGVGLFVLSSNAVHRLWKWRCSDRNLSGKSITSVPLQLRQPENRILMTNDTANGNPEEAAACSALSKDGIYLISASGGKVSLFNTVTLKIVTNFMAPPPAATFLAFHPLDSSIIAVGTEDSSIQIYNVRVNDEEHYEVWYLLKDPETPHKSYVHRQARHLKIMEVKQVLIGHQKKITGLTFSPSMDVLVSSGAEAQLCVWRTDVWKKKNSRYIQPPSNATGALVGDTMVQFHYDQTHLLVRHESHLAIYDGNLECLHLWSPRGALPSPVSSAAYSSDGLLIYAGFRDGAIGIFEAVSLTLQCRIAPSAIPSSISSGDGVVYPMAVAAHPWKTNQIAVGMNDGAVFVLEPLDDNTAAIQ